MKGGRGGRRYIREQITLILRILIGTHWCRPGSEDSQRLQRHVEVRRGHHYDEQMCGGEMGEREIRSGFVHYEDTQNGRNSLMCEAFTATRGHGDVWTHAAAEGRVWLHGPSAARIWVRIDGSCCFQRPCGFLSSGLTSEAMCVRELA